MGWENIIFTFGTIWNYRNNVIFRNETIKSTYSVNASISIMNVMSNDFKDFITSGEKTTGDNQDLHIKYGGLSIDTSSW